MAPTADYSSHGPRSSETMNHYVDSIQHVLAELERIDLLIQVQVQRARRARVVDAEFGGFCISEEEIDALLARPAGLPHWAVQPVSLEQTEAGAALAQLAARIESRKAAGREAGICLRLDRLAELFALTKFDADVLLIALAPELDLRYERLYAYLQDDINKKRPSVDLIANLLSPSFDAKLRAMTRFTARAPLRAHRLVSLFGDASDPHPPLLAGFLKIDDRVARYLMDGDELDARLTDHARLIAPEARLADLDPAGDLAHRLGLLAARLREDKSPLTLHFQGGRGTGKQEAAEALSRALELRLLVVDGQGIVDDEGGDFRTMLALADREARLQNAALYWHGFDALASEQARGHREALIRLLEVRPGLTILASRSARAKEPALKQVPLVQVTFSIPDTSSRRRLWAGALNGEASAAMTADLAEKFRFSPGLIRDAVTAARNLALCRDDGQITESDLYAACRACSNPNLSMLAQKIEPHFILDDIVLPPDRIAQLREILARVKYRGLVHETWGFDRKLSLGKGLSVLFTGPSGTGKTMAAEITAHELGLDLYRIDLAGVVSKYIGETEKNLARIFDEAETSNAILFFDEADALFGKRTEIRDAHDRYANVETSYLLQRIEAYEGVAILATNLRKNMDEAFVRRIAFTIEFPFPDAGSRRDIWQKIWPGETPRAADLDLDDLADRFEFSGGNIRNIALAAAFAAAEQGGPVTTAHLIHAIQREYRKMGKVLMDNAFTAVAPG